MLTRKLFVYVYALIYLVLAQIEIQLYLPEQMQDKVAYFALPKRSRW